ncbi:class F sortase, partial [Planosporangium mesophilum]
PVRLSIPTIDAQSTLIPLNLNPDHTVQVPPLTNPAQAGWYAPGPTPGETGASVILGHVDGYDEPGIFYHLRDLHPGDPILITRKDATTTRFTVYRTEQAPKTNFPTTKVYGPTTRPELRLITCGGTFDRQTGNYLDNIIVFAAL